MFVVDSFNILQLVRDARVAVGSWADHLHTGLLIAFHESCWASAMLRDRWQLRRDGRKRKLNEDASQRDCNTVPSPPSVLGKLRSAGVCDSAHSEFD